MKIYFKYKNPHLVLVHTHVLDNLLLQLLLSPAPSPSTTTIIVRTTPSTPTSTRIYPYLIQRGNLHTHILLQQDITEHTAYVHTIKMRWLASTLPRKHQLAWSIGTRPTLQTASASIWILVVVVIVVVAIILLIIYIIIIPHFGLLKTIRIIMTLDLPKWKDKNPSSFPSNRNYFTMSALSGLTLK